MKVETPKVDNSDARHSHHYRYADTLDAIKSEAAPGKR
jgi:hypothetical protein